LRIYVQRNSFVSFARFVKPVAVVEHPSLRVPGLKKDENFCKRVG